MRDNLRRYRAIREALTQGYQGALHGRGVQHLTPLAALRSGMVGGTSPQLPHLATQVPDGTKPESRVTRLTRWLDNDRLLEEGSFVPSAARFLTPWAWETLVVVREGRVVGRGGRALMLHVVEKGRALPLAGRVRQRPTGHGPETLPSAVVALLSPLIPEGATGVLLGDGACDGTDLQRTLHALGWSSGCRTALRTTATWNGPTFRLETLGACRKPGRLLEWQEVHVTREAYGPIMVRCGWATGYHAPRYVVSTMATAAEACRW